MEAGRRGRLGLSGSRSQSNTETLREIEAPTAPSNHLLGSVRTTETADARLPWNSVRGEAALMVPIVDRPTWSAMAVEVAWRGRRGLKRLTEAVRDVKLVSASHRQIRDIWRSQRSHRQIRDIVVATVRAIFSLLLGALPLKKCSRMITVTHTRV